MKCFYCKSCGTMIFFKNDLCMTCGHPLGFLPDVLELATLEARPDKRWEALAPPATGRTYRHCANGRDHQACNWLVPDDDPNDFCPACRLNLVIPNLADPKNLDRWAILELDKRRCLYTIFKLGLPVESPADPGVPPLRFRFLQDSDQAGPVLTGHENGIITVNIAEADSDEREHRRVSLHEPYRTLVGHFRHEVGHYFWDRLVVNTPRLARFRELFGDESVNYDTTMQAYYQNGPVAGWETRTVSAYASSHPWEDWAETWAHYLHIVDSMETAASFGISIDPEHPKGIAAATFSPVSGRSAKMDDRLIESWGTLTCALNAFNRGMGLPDLYPFVIPPPVVEKLRFIDEVVHSAPVQKPSPPAPNELKSPAPA